MWVLHEPAGTEVCFVVDNEANLEVVFGVRRGDSDVILVDLGFFLEFEHSFELLTTLTRFEHRWYDEPIKFTILLVTFAFAVGKGGGSGGVG